MRLTSLTVAGIRGFNEKQHVDLDGPLVIYWGPNSCGKCRKVAQERVGRFTDIVGIKERKSA